jgi:hypothetical protein
VARKAVLPMEAQVRFPASDELSVVSLGTPGGRNERLVGAPLAALAVAGDLADGPDTRVLTAPFEVWTSRCGAQLAMVAAELGGPVSVRGWLLRPGHRETAAAPTLNNLEPSTLPEAVTEIVAGARRQGAGVGHRVVISVQRFVAATASVLARVDPATRWLRLRACWGVAERLGEPVHFDHLLVRGRQCAVVERRVVRKPTATVAAGGGGTHTAPVSPARQLAPVLGGHAVRPLVGLCLDIADRLGAAAALRFALVQDRTYLVGCAPC